MPATESALGPFVALPGQLVASATLVDAHLASAQPNPALFGCLCHTGHEPVLRPDRGTEVDARARAAVLRADPTNRALTVRADRRERAE